MRVARSKGTHIDTQLAFVRWRSEVPSGGNNYDNELTSNLTALGLELHDHHVGGSWPFPHEQDRETFRTILESCPDDTETHWLIDNIVAAAAPEVIRTAVEAGRKVSIIMHYFPADERGLPPEIQSELATNEAVAITVASTVIATSAWTADEITRRYGRKGVVVAVPGVAPAPRVSGSLGAGRPPMLLWLGRLTETKDPVTFIRALAQLRDLHWRAELVGPDTVDLGLGRSVRRQIADAGLSGRVTVTGALEGSALQDVWSQTDLLIHTASVEAYGMVVAEALARGIPVIVPTGTGAVEAQHGVGGEFLAGNHAELSRIMRKWLSNSQLQAQWKAEAALRRTRLPTWQTTARIVANALGLV